MAMVARPASLLLFVLVASCISRAVNSSIPRSSYADATSSALSPSSATTPSRPAWNASPQITPQGYLRELYRRVPGKWEEDDYHSGVGLSDTKSSDLDVPVIVRQVPGDGDCLFHAVAVSLSLIECGSHPRMDGPECLRELREASGRLRRMAVECLRSCNSESIHPSSKRRKHSKKRYRRLFIQGCESMATSRLLATAAAQYGISSREYCDLMEQDSYWGGGPEIVALVNVLKRPIHVYELVATAGCRSDDANEDNDGEDARITADVVASCERVHIPEGLVNRNFRLRRMAAFGSPKYDSKSPINLLSADSRFPDVRPECIAENGSHFMAIFPVDVMRRWAANATATMTGSEGDGENEEEVLVGGDRKRRVRGGATANDAADDRAVCGNLASDDELGGETWLLHGEWHEDLVYSDALEVSAGWGLDESSPRTPPGGQRHGRLWLHRREDVSVRSGPWRSMNHIIELWIKVFVWTLSHFRIGF